MTITTLLLDADGVVQRNTGYPAQMARLLGERATFADLSALERPTLTGTRDLREDLAAFLIERGIQATADDVIAVWNATRPIPGVLPMVGAVRARGVRAYLATNQQAHRGGHMLATLGYERHFDGQFYSFQMGVAKPDPAFFTRIIEQLGLDPGSSLFIDDMEDNVEGARTAGLLAEHLDFRSGVDGLAAILRSHRLIGQL